MAESRESVETEADAGAEASAVESEVLGPEKVSGEALDSGISTSVSASTGTSTSGSQEQLPQHQHLPSYSRQTRNMMEKHRRDKMNAHINSLAQLVPTVANAPKKMDKTSILRLTAAYLRLHKFLNANAGGYVAKLEFPRYLKDFDMYQALMEVMDGFLIIVSHMGNILFVTHTVETVLGHPQSFLMGQKLHSITFHEDHEVLNKNLTPDSDPSLSDHDGSGQLSAGDDNSSSRDTSSSSSQSALSPQQPSSSTSTVSANTNRNPSPDHQRRSFFVRLSQRTASRSDVTQYEMVHIQGFLRVPQHSNPGPSVHSRTRSRTRDGSNTGSGNDIDTVLIAVVRTVRERNVSSRSLLHATREEYVTRHLLDGRIIYCDYRISLVAGYMASEIQGLSAFKFMHKDDVLYTIVALGEMYHHGKQSFGSSCYRLLSKTGQFIYLHTHGYLEYDGESKKSVSFLCVNTLLSEEEGSQRMQEMKARYASGMQLYCQKANVMLPSSVSSTSADACSGMDSHDLDAAVSHLLASIPPTDDTEEEKCAEVSDSQYIKVLHYAKHLPPVSVQTAKMGIDPYVLVSCESPASPTRPLTVTIPEAPSRLQPESGWSKVKRESVIMTLLPSIKAEPVPPPPPRRHESVVVNAQGNQTGSVPECMTGVRGRANPALKRTSTLADCDVQSSSKRQHMSYARRRERCPKEPTAKLKAESSTLDEPRRIPDEQLRLIMMREASVTSPSASSSSHCTARGCSEPTPMFPAHGGDFGSPDFQSSPGNFTVKINQTLVHSPNHTSPIPPMMYVPLNITAGSPSPGPQSPARNSNSVLEFSATHHLSSAHSPSQLPTQVASFSLGVGYGSLIDSCGPSGPHSPSHFTSTGSFGLERSSLMGTAEMTGMNSPGDSFSSLETLDADLVDLLAANTSMFLPSTGPLFDGVGSTPEQSSVSEQLPLVEQRLAQTHRELGTSLQLQRRNINLIEDDMQQYPLNIASEVLRPQITQIKAITSCPATETGTGIDDTAAGSPQHTL